MSPQQVSTGIKSHYLSQSCPEKCIAGLRCIICKAMPVIFRLLTPICCIIIDKVDCVQLPKQATYSARLSSNKVDHLAGSRRSWLSAHPASVKTNRHFLSLPSLHLFGSELSQSSPEKQICLLLSARLPQLSTKLICNTESCPDSRAFFFNSRLVLSFL